jgi:hypothetical protein
VSVTPAIGRRCYRANPANARSGQQIDGAIG